MQFISELTSLTCCSIVNTGDTVDLTPLKELANLEELHLTAGPFLAADLPAHLINLMLIDANRLGSVSGVGLSTSCVTSLRRLEVINAHMSGLHPCGLLACTALQELLCCRCLISADMQENTINFTLPSDSCMPLGILALTSLSRLVLGLGQDGGLLDLAPLHALSLLQGLHVISEGAGLECSAGLCSLHKLTSLILVRPDDRPDDDRPVVNIDVEWSSMHDLQHLILVRLSVNCTSSIVELTA